MAYSTFEIRRRSLIDQRWFGLMVQIEGVLFNSYAIN